MTVNHLWEILDEAKCGRSVGTIAFQGKKIAIDLSIWICEGFTSPSLARYHSSPAVFLVFARIASLLKLGTTPVVCIEGKKRLLYHEKDGSFLIRSNCKRPKEFIKATNECVKVLKMLGCPILQSEFEAEALCGQLSLKGLVDGVITNDGDCFLYGAQRVFTKFSTDNLTSSNVIVYDAKDLKGKLTLLDKSEKIVYLKRDDLVAFAFFTGSDLVGKGVKSIGGSKVIRFLHNCKAFEETPPLQVIRLWKQNLDQPANNVSTEELSTCKLRTCSRCMHPGDCRQHERKGCSMCDTAENQLCRIFSSSDKFQKGLREKAMKSDIFANEIIIEAYLQQGQKIPSKLLTLNYPNMTSAIETDLIIYGKSQQSSQSYMITTTAKVMARYLLNQTQTSEKHRNTEMDPIPKFISKHSIHKGYQCFEVTWSIPTLSLEFVSFEWEDLITNKYPIIVSSFIQQQRKHFQRSNHNKRMTMFITDNQTRRFRKKVKRVFQSKSDNCRILDQKAHNRGQTDTSLLLRFVKNTTDPNKDSKADQVRCLSQESPNDSEATSALSIDEIITPNKKSTIDNIEKGRKVHDIDNFSLDSSKTNMSVCLGPYIQMSPIARKRE